MKNATRFCLCFSIHTPLVLLNSFGYIPIYSAILFSFVILFFHSSIYCQQYSSINYSIDNGLPTNNVYRIAQTTDGFIWLATDAGLVRFDGFRFKVFTVEDGISDNEILLINADTSNHLIISPYRGDVAFTQNGELRHTKTTLQSFPKINYTKGTNPPFVRTIVSEFGGFYYFVNDSLFSFKNSKVNFLGHFPTCKLVHILEAKEGHTIVITDSTYTIYSQNKQLRKVLDKELYSIINSSSDLCSTRDGSTYYLLCEKKIMKLYLDANLNFEVKGVKSIPIAVNANQRPKLIENQLLYMDMQGKVYSIDTLINSKSEVNYLLNARTFFVDRNKNIWLATANNGVVFLYRNFRQKLGIPLQSKEYSTVYWDADSRLWTGDFRGEVKCYDKGHLMFSQNLDYGRIRKIHFDIKTKKVVLVGEGTMEIWKETVRNKFQKEYSTGNLSIKDFDLDSMHNFFIASAGGLNYLAKTKNVHEEIISGIRLSAIAVTNNELYLGFPDALCSVNLVRDKPIRQFDTLLRTRVTKLAKSENGLVFTLTSNNTIVVLKGRKVIGKFDNHINPFFRVNVINDLKAGKDNLLWIASDNGLYQLNYLLSEEGIVFRHLNHFTQQDGLVSNYVNGVCLNDTLVYVATSMGISAIPTLSNTLVPRYPLKVIGFSINQRDTIVLPHYELGYSQNNIKITFTSICFGYNSGLYYTYQLEGIDKFWNTTKQNSIEYISLPPGSYKFLLKAFNSSGKLISEETTQVSFTIIPPFYEKMWFRILLLVLLIAFISIINIVLTRSRNKKLEAQRKLKNVIYDLELKALRAQMNPHFIFNALASIQHFINENDGENANRYLSRFAKLIRLTLDMSGQQTICLKEEIEYLENYVSLERMRFQNQFEVNFCYHPNLKIDSVLILPMLLQPFIENAIKHGLRNRLEQGGLLEIRFEEKKDYLVIEIDDNGIGRKQAAFLKKESMNKHTSKGMGVTLSRIEAYNQISDSKIGFEIIDKRDEEGKSNGTRVVLRVPLNYSV